jgi:hypothetical protein
MSPTSASNTATLTMHQQQQEYIDGRVKWVTNYLTVYIEKVAKKRIFLKTTIRRQEF